MFFLFIIALRALTCSSLLSTSSYSFDSTRHGYLSSGLGVGGVCGFHEFPVALGGAADGVPSFHLEAEGGLALVDGQGDAVLLAGLVGETACRLCRHLEGVVAAIDADGDQHGARSYGLRGYQGGGGEGFAAAVFGRITQCQRSGGVIERKDAVGADVRQLLQVVQADGDITGRGVFVSFARLHGDADLRHEVTQAEGELIAESHIRGFSSLVVLHQPGIGVCAGYWGEQGVEGVGTAAWVEGIPVEGCGACPGRAAVGVCAGGAASGIGYIQLVTGSGGETAVAFRDAARRVDVADGDGFIGGASGAPVRHGHLDGGLGQVQRQRQGRYLTRFQHEGAAERGGVGVAVTQRHGEVSTDRLRDDDVVRAGAQPTVLIRGAGGGSGDGVAGAIG